MNKENENLAILFIEPDEYNYLVLALGPQIQYFNLEQKDNISHRGVLLSCGSADVFIGMKNKYAK